ncbi:SIMPL domain-containing protein [Polyangium sp. y55x31]|uniref:SIMPL domain-containing protein n=1 Tax=Polyangium sp. y55x31 TaxID=3042688 RepID=UPI0024830CE5|nr:SIMPL domain-containing protein [Polyangium sp. y55x31]MDI1478208.1 SIMPL domain-containing protein [Polyangium sp. y55x31]
MRFGSVLAFVLLVPASFGLIGCGGPHHGGGWGARASQEAVRHITVVGHGEAQGKPDIARTSLGVEASAPTVEEAMNQTSARMKAILDALKKLGIEEKDIQTANFSISVERPFMEGPMPVPMPMPVPEAAPAPKGGKAAAAAAPAAAPVAPPPQPSVKYRVSNTVEVTIRDVSKASRVLQAAVDAGANNVWSVSFGIDETKALEATAREKAIADAKARAEALAKLSGLELGPVISVSEVIGRGPIGPMPMMATAEAKWGGGGPPLSMGEVTYSTSIEVIFGIKPITKTPESAPAE